jgi:PPK2 family polyphosphate:nucleotide phosphotransferase
VAAAPRDPGRALALPDPGDTAGEDRDEAKKELPRLVEALAEQQERLYAGRARALLVILQGMDASGKDGTVRHVFSGVNPQGVRVSSFKEPTPRESAEDFLWRVHQAVPPKGLIGVFNRSHYEDVLVVRVHGLVPESVWRPRFRAINDFERALSESGVVVLKFFLHISREEQLKRFTKRLLDPKRHWKFSPADLREREHWDAYSEAYADVLRQCSTDWAPWHVVPADHKWYRNLVVARTVVRALEALDLHFPPLPSPEG